jgi:hypothetical protein
MGRLEMPEALVADVGLRPPINADVVAGATYLMYVGSSSEAETRDRDRDRAKARDAGVKPAAAAPPPVVRSVNGRPNDDVTDVAVGTRRLVTL